MKQTSGVFVAQVCEKPSLWRRACRDGRRLFVSRQYRVCPGVAGPGSVPEPPPASTTELSVHLPLVLKSYPAD